MRRSRTAVCSTRRSISGLPPPHLILPDRKRDGWTKLSHQTAVYRAGGPRGGAVGLVGKVKGEKSLERLQVAGLTVGH